MHEFKHALNGLRTVRSRQFTTVHTDDAVAVTVAELRRIQKYDPSLRVFSQATGVRVKTPFEPEPDLVLSFEGVCDRVFKAHALASCPCHAENLLVDTDPHSTNAAFIIGAPRRWRRSADGFP